MLDTVFFFIGMFVASDPIEADYLKRYGFKHEFSSSRNDTLWRSEAVLVNSRKFPWPLSRKKNAKTCYIIAVYLPRY